MNQTRKHQLILSITLVIGMILTSSASAQEVVNLLMDPDFEEPVLGWNLATRAPAAATLTIDNIEKKFGPASARIEITNVGNGASVHELTLDNQAGIAVTANTTYTVDFWAKAEADRTLIVDALLNQDPWTNLFRVRDLPVTTEWTVIHHTFQANATMAPVVFLFSFVDSTTTIWLDHVRFYEGEFVEEDESLESASNPNPLPGAMDVGRDANLGWTPGEFANTHDVYLGTAFDDVNDASSANPMAVLVSSGQDANTFDPGYLTFGQTYYWRVDEVNGAPDYTVFKGDIWSFTVEPFAYAIEGIIATSNGVSDATSGPEKMVDGSGLNAAGQHSTGAADMWLATPGTDPLFIQFEFDRLYVLYEMLAWNYNVQFELVLGFGVKDVTVEYSADGAEWMALGDVEFARATARADYTANTSVSFGGIAARFVRLNVNSGHGPMGQFGLSEVSFSYKPVVARQPIPPDGQTDIPLDLTLDWRAGREVVVHDVHLSADRAAVEAGTALVDSVDTSNLAVGDLDLGTTYYWKVDEVNEAATTWPGDIWSFSTKEFALIDGFEEYDDEENRIFDVWLDGFVNGTGATVGYFEAPFAEQSIVNSGRQSMPLEYNNTGAPFYSEAEFDLGGADLTTGGAVSLRLFFHGDATNVAETLYVAIADSAGNVGVAAHPDPDAALADSWQEWVIPYSELTASGVNLSRAAMIYIGLGDRNNPTAGGTGMVFIDDVGFGTALSGI